MKKKLIIGAVVLIILVIVTYGLLKKSVVPYFVEASINYLLKDHGVFPADMITGHVEKDENKLYQTPHEHENDFNVGNLNPQLPDIDKNVEVVVGDSRIHKEDHRGPVVVDKETTIQLELENKKDIAGDISDSEIYHGKRVHRVKSRSYGVHAVGSQNVSKKSQGKMSTLEMKTLEMRTLEMRTLEEIQSENKNLVGALKPTKIKPIAILVDSMGENATITKKIIDMKYNLNLSFIPYGKHVKYQVAYAKKRNKTIVVQMSMQPLNGNIKLTPHALLVTDSQAQLKKKIAWNLSQFQGYNAVTTHMGSRFVKYEAGLNILMSELKRRNLSFIDALPVISSKAYKIAIKHKIPTLKRNIFVNNNQSYGRTLKSFDKVIHMANKYGYTLAIVYPSVTTIKALNVWLEKISKDKHYKLVTINQLINHIYNVHPTHVSQVIIQ